MIIDLEIIIIVAAFLITVLGLVYNFSKMQTKQTGGIDENKKAISKNETAIARIDARTASCEHHQNRIEEIEAKVKHQTSYNIETEKNVNTLMVEFEYIKQGQDEMKADIKELLRLRQEGK